MPTIFISQKMYLGGSQFSALKVQNHTVLTLMGVVDGSTSCTSWQSMEQQVVTFPTGAETGIPQFLLRATLQ